jgi:hypothetical protein
MPQPSSPPPASNGNGNGNHAGPEGERIARLEERQKTNVQTLVHLSEGHRELWRAYHHMQEVGRQVIHELPATIDARVRPLEDSIKEVQATLEQRWWEPMRPHLWKIYIAVAIIVASRLHRYFTGQPLDVPNLLGLFLR